MSWALVVQKNKEKLQKEILDQVKNESVDKDSDIVEGANRSERKRKQYRRIINSLFCPFSGFL